MNEHDLVDRFKSNLSLFKQIIHLTESLKNIIRSRGLHGYVGVPPY